MEFGGLLGNAALKQRLSASFRTGRVSHCYLLCGPVGSGRKTLAALLSAALECQSGDPPCMRCAACRKAAAGIHPDIITVDEPEKKTVSVERIRQLQADAYIRPNEGQRKVYVIPRAQSLTDSAQNALLKLIEEPPSYAVFLLLSTNAAALLATVRSRCAELRLEPVPWADALPWLQRRFPQETRDRLQGAYIRAGGYLGQAEALLHGPLLLPQTVQFAQAYTQSDRCALIQLLCTMEKLPRDQLLEILQQWKSLLTDALSARAGIPGDPEATALGQRRTAAALAAAAGHVQQAMEYCAANIGTGHICGWLAVSL